MSDSMKSLKDWGNEEILCECGLVVKNKVAKKHKGSELCTFLKTTNNRRVRGSDKVRCDKCNSFITVCGLHIHSKFCNK